MEVSSEQALGIYPCQVLYYWVFYSSAVGGSWPPCPATWKLLVLLVAQWLTFQWSTLTRTGGVGYIRARIGIKGTTPSDSWVTNWMSYRPHQCHLAQLHPTSTNLHQAASLISQIGITYSCPRNSLPHCQQHFQNILENKPCCSQHPE